MCLRSAMEKHEVWYRIFDDNLGGVATAEEIGRAFHSAAFLDGRIFQFNFGCSRGNDVGVQPAQCA